MVPVSLISVIVVLPLSLAICRTLSAVKHNHWQPGRERNAAPIRSLTSDLCTAHVASRGVGIVHADLTCPQYSNRTSPTYESPKMAVTHLHHLRQTPLPPIKSLA
jgi:hypothetical protein